MVVMAVVELCLSIRIIMMEEGRGSVVTSCGIQPAVVERKIFR
jgi:hypothetical protein